MAFKHGKGSTVLFGIVDLTAYLNALDFGVDIDSAETSTFGDTWKTHIAGQMGATVGFGGFYDPTDTTIVAAIGAEDGILTWGPGGGGAEGDAVRLALIAATSYSEGSPVGDAVSIAWDVLTDGVVGFGQVLHPLGAETSTDTGGAVDGGAQSATGAIAHLHCTAATAGDTLDVTIEDSPNGSTGWAVIGTFTQIASATPAAERITISGTIERYTRAVGTIAGDGGESFTYACAIART